MKISIKDKTKTFSMKPARIIPDELRFAITRKCNGNCRHCYNSSGKNTDRLSTADILKLLKDTHSLNPNLDRITLTGGEPLNELQRILDIAELAKSLGIRVRLVTRGWELDKDLCAALKMAGVTRIQIGLDSSGIFDYVDAKNKKWDTFHSWLRAEHDAFEKTVTSIKTAVSEGLNVSIRYSACKSNVKDIVNTYQMVSGLGVSKFKFRLLFPDGRAKKSLVNELINGKDLARAQYNLIHATNNDTAEVEITQPCFYKLAGKSKSSKRLNGFNSYKQACSCGTVAAYIDSNGDVKYCLFDEEILGNVFDHSFLKIWNSDATEIVRDKRTALDKSGFSCSSFKMLYDQHLSYSSFMKDYYREVQKHI